MKFAVIIEYSADKEALSSVQPAHQTYFRTFLTSGQLLAAGPFADDAGALWVLDAGTSEEVENIVKGDPFVDAGVFKNWKIVPFAYWSAKEAKGAR